MAGVLREWDGSTWVDVLRPDLLAHTHPIAEVIGLGTSAPLDVPASGNATTSQVVKGSDTRLTDARTPLAHTHLAANITDLSKTSVGLGSVDNTADSAKPVSTAQQAALDLKAPIASPTFTGTVGGVTKAMVGLSAVDNTSDANKPVSTAQQTALNAKANLASPTFTGTVGGVTKAMVGLSSVDNTADASKPVSTAQQAALDLKANLASPALTGTPTINGQAILTSSAEDPWHYVGAAGEPAYQNAWTQSAESLRFRKDSVGNVHIQGRAVKGTDATDVFTLPAAYRPTMTLRTQTLSNAAFALVSVVIGTDGTVSANWDASNGTEVNLTLPPYTIF